MNEDMEQGKPTTVGQYYLMEKIAQGGMAEIFKGLSYDVHGLKKTVCIKKILPHLSASQEFISSLIDEAKLAVKLVHGNIAQTFDLGKVGDDYFMVMEYVDGKSLSQINKKCASKGERIPIPFLLYFIAEALSGLDYMHRRTDEFGNLLNIVHRDVSPQNIMVSFSGTVKIIDFGIAKTTFKAGSTDSGILKGKFAYMSPEQAHGDAIDSRSDIFSIGIILHEFLTGQRLFKAEDSRQTIRNVRRAQVPLPSAVQPDILEDLDEIVMKALAKDRRLRFNNASEFYSNIQKFLHTRYPDFKPSDAAGFMLELFADEINKPLMQEADSKTPHLIIDRTNSALADDSQFEATGFARAPLNIKEYMLESMAALEETKTKDLQKDEGDKEDKRATRKNKELDDLQEEKTHFSFPAFIKDVKKVTVAVGLIVAAFFMIYTIINWVKMSSDKNIKDIVPKKPVASLSVETDPRDALVYIDDKVVGGNSPVIINGIAAGKKHDIKIVRDGYLPQSQEINLAADEDATISITLQKKAPEPAKIEFESNPSGAVIYIDDKETTLKTPATIESFKPNKEYRIGLYLKGYQFWSKKVILKEGERKSIDVSFSKDFGSLFVESEPSGASVLINGALSGHTPFKREKLEPGKIYKIEVERAGYETFVREIKSIAGREEEIKAYLKKIPLSIDNQQ